MLLLFGVNGNSCKSCHHAVKCSEQINKTLGFHGVTQRQWSGKSGFPAREKNHPEKLGIYLGAEDEVCDK